MPAPLRLMPPVTAPDGLLDPTVPITIAEASRLTGTPEHRVRYALNAGHIAGAHRLPGDGAARWAFPLGSLVGAGLLDAARVSRTSTTAYSIALATSGARPVATEAAMPAVEHTRLLAEVEDLRRQLADKQDEVAFLRSLLAGGSRGSAA